MHQTCAQLPAVLCPICSTVCSQVSLLGLFCWDFSPPPVALAIHLQTSNYRLSMGTGGELWHLINKVSLSRQNSLMKMTLMKDVCFSCCCHRGSGPQGDWGTAAAHALQECDLETEGIMSWCWLRPLREEVWALLAASVPIVALPLVFGKIKYLGSFHLAYFLLLLNSFLFLLVRCIQLHLFTPLFQQH